MRRGRLNFLKMNDSFESDTEWLKSTSNRNSTKETGKSTNSGKASGPKKAHEIGKSTNSGKTSIPKKNYEIGKSINSGKTSSPKKLQEVKQISIFRPNRVSTPVSRKPTQQSITKWFVPDRRGSPPKKETSRKDEKVLSRGKKAEGPQHQQRSKKVEVDSRKRKVDPPQRQEAKKKIEIEPPVLTLDDSIFNDSFDELKLPEKPKGEVVVRKKDERRKLHGHECGCCKKYYDALDLNPEERAKRVNEVSRHRTTYRPLKRAKTPEHFWEIDFPDTQEALRRGYFKRMY